mmetsp:Transcript_6290/g.9247  ORF Transcript_6290/g.9247 Transcript_6290/m.9247 type:complete len:106 (-) Transcript_6290:194-511(-)
MFCSLVPQPEPFDNESTFFSDDFIDDPQPIFEAVPPQPLPLLDEPSNPPPLGSDPLQLPVVFVLPHDDLTSLTCAEVEYGAPFPDQPELSLVVLPGALKDEAEGL